MGKEKWDFAGWASKNNLKCSDGRIIRENAFIDNDGERVPLVYQHNHADIFNVVGHADLINRPEGVFTYGYFNYTPEGEQARQLVQHGDVTSLSIYANNLKQRGNEVLHGNIREVSLVLSPANPGAKIVDVAIAHGEDESGEAVIFTGEPIELYHAEKMEEQKVDEKKEEAKEEKKEEKKEAKKEESEKTIQEVFDTFTDEQKEVVYYMIGAALEEGGATGNEGEEEMKHNVFENDKEYMIGGELTHSDLMAVGNELCSAAVNDAKNYGGSFRDAFLAHAGEYGIGNIDYLFPDAKAIDAQPEFIKREDAWVSEVINGTKHLPFSRIKTLFADLTEEDARARGYLNEPRGSRKVEEFFSLAKRETTPTTIYKKQKLDRQDIIDATTIDVVNWLWTEMRLMLNEEIARAILIGDGRSVQSADKISEEHIRPIVSSEDLFCVKKNFTAEEVESVDAMIEAMSKAHSAYRGSGAPILFVSPSFHSDMLWVRDIDRHKMYASDAELCSALRVSKIVEVPLLEDFQVSETVEGVTTTYDIYGIKVSLKDYSVGTDKGGEITTFDDFDIDYNQYKYLIEGRMSGSLTKWHCAQVFRAVAE